MGCSDAAGKGPMGRVECGHSNRVAVDVVDGPLLLVLVVVGYTANDTVSY